MKKLLSLLQSYRLKVHNKQGFTLIELILVVVIVGILAAIATMAFGNYGDKAKNARIRSDMETLATATQKYYADTGSWPSVSEITATDSESSGLCKILMNQVSIKDVDGGGNLKRGPWLEQCPRAPYDDGKYTFTFSVTGFDIKESHTGMQLKKLK